MKKLKLSRNFKNKIKKILLKILITVALSMVMSFILSLFLDHSFDQILKFVSFIILVIGALSVLGGTKTTYDGSYQWLKAQTGMTSTTKNDLELLVGSYGFCIFMAISAVILYFISYYISL